MNKSYCEVCGRETTDMSNSIDAVNYKIVRTWAWSNDAEAEINLCQRCHGNLLYYIKYKSVLNFVVNKMTLKNRIRFLLKLPLKESTEVRYMRDRA